MLILLVEDSAIQGTVLKRLLTGRGYDVDWARDGAAALEAITVRRPGLVLTDVEMPGMNGFDLCSAIKKNPATRDIPVVLLSSLNHVDDVVRGLQAGADNYLTKPYEEQHLLDKLASVAAAGHGHRTGETVEIMVGGQPHQVAAELHQVLNLLISTYEGAVRQNRELVTLNQKLVSSQQEVARRNQELEGLNQVKNQFLGMAAHDLRNPLAVVLAYTRFLSLDLEQPAEKRFKFIAKIQSSADFMLRLIDDLLDISKIEAGKLELNLADTDVLALVRQNVELNNTLAEQKGLRIVLEEHGTPATMRVDAPKLEQVLNNLISNALKFSHAGTTVTITTATEDPYLIIRVRDQGQGIPPEEVERLFHPFSTTTTRATAGEKSTGLGLAIAHKIIEGHGGSTTVESEIGKGTEFAIMLPLRAPVAASFHTEG